MKKYRGEHMYLSNADCVAAATSAATGNAAILALCTTTHRTVLDDKALFSTEVFTKEECALLIEESAKAFWIIISYY